MEAKFVELAIGQYGATVVLAVAVVILTKVCVQLFKENKTLQIQRMEDQVKYMELIREQRDYYAASQTVLIEVREWLRHRARLED